jgi:hypothetical protein
MAKGRITESGLPSVWPTILSNQERVKRFLDVYHKNRALGITQNDITARDMGLNRSTVSKQMADPSILFTLKYCYLYELDPLEIFPELIWLRDRWLKEFQDHLELLKQAAQLKNPSLIIELVEACEYGLSLYLSPELIGEMKKLRGEAINTLALAKKGQSRRKKHETRLEARLRQNEESANT